jgi:rubrerythrin
MLGIKLEKGSWDFYMAAVNKFEPPQVKDTFHRLANAEDGHMQRLYQRALNLLPHSSLPPLDELKKELKVEYMEGGIEISQALATNDNKFADEMDALEIALEKEYMSYDFYKQTSALVKDPDARALLHELALEERHHADVLLERVVEIVR